MNLQPKDRVAYAVQWLRSIGAGPTNELCHDRGTVLSVTADSAVPRASVLWDGETEPRTVGLVALAKVGPNSRYCAC